MCNRRRERAKRKQRGGGGAASRGGRQRASPRHCRPRAASLPPHGVCGLGLLLHTFSLFCIWFSGYAAFVSALEPSLLRSHLSPLQGCVCMWSVRRMSGWAENYSACLCAGAMLLRQLKQWGSRDADRIRLWPPPPPGASRGAPGAWSRVPRHQGRTGQGPYPTGTRRRRAHPDGPGRSRLDGAPRRGCAGLGGPLMHPHPAYECSAFERYSGFLLSYRGGTLSFCGVGVWDPKRRGAYKVKRGWGLHDDEAVWKSSPPGLSRCRSEG